MKTLIGMLLFFIALNALAAGIDWFAETQSDWFGPLILWAVIAACIYGIARELKK